MRLRKNIRPPRRYEDELERSPSSATASVDMTSRRSIRGTTPAFEIPSKPYNPALVHSQPAAFPSRDITGDWGPSGADGIAAKKLQKDDAAPSTPKQSSHDELHEPHKLTPQQISVLTSTPRSLRAIFPTSGVRSDLVTQRPRKQKPKVDTIRRRRPPPNLAFANIIPYFAEPEEPRLEEVWDAFGQNSSSFFNQAIGAPPHGIGDLVLGLYEDDEPNDLRHLPSLKLEESEVVLAHSRPNEKVGTSSRKGNDEVQGRDSSHDKPVNFVNMKPEKISAWRKGHSTDCAVNPQNGPFYDAEFADEDFFFEAASSGDEKSQQRVQISSQPLLFFDDLVAQLAIDIYCQIYFEAAALVGNGESVCRNLLDFTHKSDECMHWIIAKRLLEKVDEMGVPYNVPEGNFDREVRRGASPPVSSFMLSGDRNRLVRIDIDWNYVAAADLEIAETFLRSKNLPQSLLRDWTSERGTEPRQQQPPASPLAPRPHHYLNEVDKRPKSLTDRIPANRTIASAANYRGQKRPASDSEYHEDEDEDEADAPNDTSASAPRYTTPCPALHAPNKQSRKYPHQQQHQQQQHVPPRPSFAKPGVSIAKPRGASATREPRPSAASAAKAPRTAGRGQAARATKCARVGDTEGATGEENDEGEEGGESYGVVHGAKRGRGRPSKREEMAHRQG